MVCCGRRFLFHLGTAYRSQVMPVYTALVISIYGPPFPVGGGGGSDVITAALREEPK